MNIESADANLLDELTIDGKDGDEGGEGDGKQPPGGDLAARVSAMEAQLTRIADLQVRCQPCLLYWLGSGLRVVAASAAAERDSLPADDVGNLS